MELPELQRAFQGYVLAGDARIVQHVDPGRLRNGERRLRIYHDAYRSRLVEALSSDFEALAVLLGAEAFRALCLAYVEATPSHWRNVRWYGRNMADFLGSTPPWSGYPLLAECARFEWTLTLAFDGPDVPAATFDALSALPAQAWECLRIALHPTAHLLRLHGNVGGLRRAIDEGRDPPEIVWHDAPIDWLVWRKGMDVHFRSLDATERAALDVAAGGARFATICAALAQRLSESEVAAHAARFLRTWVDDGLIVVDHGAEALPKA